MKIKLIVSFFLIFNSFASAQDFNNVKINVTKAGGNVYMLQGAGGNIGVLATKQGLILVDDQFSPLAERINNAMNGISKQGLKYIVNTHFHGDHTGSNSFFSEKAPIFAHKNVRTRLAEKEPAEQVALPVVTYEKGLAIYLDDEEIQLTHYAHGHTDGDTTVSFKKANVLHTGDLFFELGFPYIDLNNGGSVKGYLTAVQNILSTIPDDIVIIPGHGKLTNKKRYQAFADMIAFSINHVQQLLDQGKTEKDIIAQGLGKDYQQWSWEFITEEKWLKTIISDLK